MVTLSKIKTEVMGRDSELIRATNFFGDSQRCGEVMSIESVAKALSVRAQDVPSCIDALRSVRWDVRVRETHRTLSAGSVLCTYPFPTLSEKAHFEKGSAMGPDFNSTAVDVAV